MRLIPLGIVLCDPLLDDRPPSKVHLRTYNELPLFSEQHKILKPQFQPKQTSTLSNLLNAILNLSASSPDEIRTQLLEKSIALALGFTSAALFELRARTRIDSRYLPDKRKPAYALMLKKLHNSGGWNGVHDALRYSLNNIIRIHMNLLPPNSEGRQGLECELSYLDATHAEVKRRSSHQMEHIGQEQEIAFTQSLERLTTITMVFAPFGAVAQIFSIQDTDRFSWFAVMVIPIAMLCMLFGIRGMSRKDARWLLECCTRTWNRVVRHVLYSRRHLDKGDKRSNNSDVEESGGKPQGKS